MKIKDIAALANACRTMSLVNERSLDGEILRQYLSLNGLALYPLDGMQPITPETLLTIADVEAGNREKYTVNEVEMNNRLLKITSDAEPGDEPAQLSKLTIEGRLFKLAALLPENGGAPKFLKTRLLKPIKDEEQLNFVFRQIGEDEEIIVAKSGVLAIAAFAPSVLWATGDEAMELTRFASAARKLAEANALREQEAK